MSSLNYKTAELPGYVETEADDEIVFSSKNTSYCVGMIDIVGSTKIASRLSNGKICEFYSTFLNFMSSVAKSYDAVIVKNIGDGILWYFPKTLDCLDPLALLKSLSCGMAMVDAHETINKIMLEKSLPQVDYRISFDYGSVNIAKSQLSMVEDIFGPTVNMCAKINIAAEPNSMVIGGDLFQVVRTFKDYTFSSRGGYWTGFQVAYPIYSVSKHMYCKKLSDVFRL